MKPNALLGFAVAAAIAAGTWWLARDGAGREPVSPAGDANTVPVVILLIDTLRADRVGAYGYDRDTTPNLDRFAREAVTFERAYAAAPWTLPSLASLRTSTYPCEHGIVRTGLRLNNAVPTLAERMQGLGYTTASYYHNPYAGPVSGLDRGYQVSEYRGNIRELTADVRAFLDRHGDQPLLLYLHSLEPHQSFETPSRYISAFGHVSIDDRESYRAHLDVYKTALTVDFQAQRPLGSVDVSGDVDQAAANLSELSPQINTLYDAAVLWADDRAGRLFDVLRERGLWDRALVIVLSDHGEEFGEHGTWFHDQSVYRELVRVPLMIKFPRSAHGGTRVAERVSLLDVKPTILDYLGAAGLCDGCRGQSLLPLLDQARGDYRSSDVAALRINEHAYHRGWQARRGDVNVALRDADWRAVWNADHDTVELYDRHADPGETANLSASKPEIARRFADRARDWLDACRQQLRQPLPALADDDANAAIRALGYAP